VGKPPKQRRKEQLQRQRETQEAARLKHRRRQRVYAALALVALAGLVLSGVLAAVRSSNNDQTTTTNTSVAASTPPTTGVSLPPVSVSAPPPGETITGETPCPAPDGSSPRVTSFENPPPHCIDDAKHYNAIIHTTEGDMTALLNIEQAPETVNNFVVLSRYHFYDGAPFFAIIPRMMMVTGDVTGDPVGTGGPGYTIPSEVPDVGVIYYWGALAMFNSEGAPTSGSQFLIGSGENVAAIPPDYTVFGTITDGEGPVNAIQKAGSQNGTPTKNVAITSIEIVESDAPA
jgi:cyclophilin family peptidyl-prolyl cis-trans isomerase